MARIAFLSMLGGQPWGGCEELWAGAALRLQESGHAVTACVYDWPERVPELDALERKGIIINRRSLHATLMDRLARKFLASGFETNTVRWLRRFRPDLVVISQGEALTGLGWMLACQAQGWRYAVISQANWEGFWPDDAVAAAALDAYRKASRAYFVSHGNLRLLCEQLGGSIPGAEVVSNPFAIPYSPANMQFPRDDIFRLACVARLEPKAKGQDLLFRVLARDKWRARPVELRLYGKGASEHSLRRLAAELRLPKVQFEGHVDNVEEIWRRNHALILPSRFEGMPLALIEAMLCARTAIVTDVGGNAELVEDNVSGFVAAAPTADLLDEAMERAWAQCLNWEQLGVQARRRVTSLVPSDPVGEFSRRLLAAAPAI